jgi:hypothetical protein
MDNNLKDKITNICGVIVVICGALLTSTTQGVTLPTWLTGAAGVLSALSIGIIGYLTGKKPDGTVKTPGQIADGNNPVPSDVQPGGGPK